VKERSSESITAALERWFAERARDLPWRQPSVRGGYAALVSEAMLQQTQVSRVVVAFVAFMARFPTVADLAAADEQEVLAAWTGLGYYRRARHLHAAAKVVVAAHDGEVPADLESLRSLPGVGRYTAGAIASIAFGKRAAIVDGNVARVLLRLRGRDMGSDEPQAQRWAWAEAERLVEASTSPAAFNEGLMELGAVVCTPRSPDCDACPLSQRCVANAQGTTATIPRPRKTTARLTVHHHAVVVRRGARILLEQRGDDGLWASMWQVPTIESAAPLGIAGLRKRLTERGVVVDELSATGAFVHLTTHREVRFHVHRAKSTQRRGDWVAPANALERPMSAAMRRIVAMT